MLKKGERWVETSGLLGDREQWSQHLETLSRTISHCLECDSGATENQISTGTELSSSDSSQNE